MKYFLYIVALFAYTHATFCHITEITRVVAGGSPSVLHSCPMPGGQAQCIQEFEDVYIFKDGKIVTQDGTWCAIGHSSKWDVLPILIPEDVEFREEQGTVAVLSVTFQECWGHWLLEILPRLYILQQSGLEYDSIYFYDRSYSYMITVQQQSLYAVLDYLGISHEKLVVVGPEVCLYAHKVLRPSYPYFFTCTGNRYFPLWIRDFLQNIFLPKNGEQDKYGASHLYISRSDSHRRRVNNEEEVVRLLELHGFKKVVLSEFTAHEQAALFNQASCIVAQFGSALANIVFCQPSVKILEIDRKFVQPRNDFKGLAGFLGLTYKKFEMGLAAIEDTLENFHADVSVDIPEFEKYLKEFLNGGECP